MAAVDVKADVPMCPHDMWEDRRVYRSSERR